jgi:hypothetical protein
MALPLDPGDAAPTDTLNHGQRPVLPARCSQHRAPDRDVDHVP